MLAKPHAGTATVFVDEIHTGILEGASNDVEGGAPRRWYQRATGQVTKDVQTWFRRVIRWMAATLDEIVEGNSAVPNRESTPIRRTRSNHFRNLCF